MKKMPKTVPVTREVLDAVAGYLLSRPMGEVEHLVNLLRAAVIAADKATVARAPEENVDA